MSTIRDHIREMHRQISPLPRSNKDAAKAHVQAHHRLHCNHTHKEDNAGNLVGPGSNRRRPSGWNTGLGVVMRHSKLTAASSACRSCVQADPGLVCQADLGGVCPDA